MVTAKHNRNGTCRENSADPSFDVCMALYRVCMHNIGIANISNTDFIGL